MDPPEDYSEMMEVDSDAPEDHHPLDLMCYDVWLKLMEYLPDPRDRLNLSDSCTFFNELFSFQEPELRFQEAIPLILKHVDKKDTLTCRLISKRVTSSVDKILEVADGLSQVEHQNSPFPRLVPPCPSPSWKSYDWRHFSLFPDTYGWTVKSVYKLEQLWKDTDQRRVRKFVGSGLDLEFPRPPEDANFHEEFLQISVASLTMWQDKLRYLKLSIVHRHSVMGSESYEILRTILSSLPNLRCLHVKFNVINQILDPNQEDFQLARRMVLEGQGHSLPQLPHLDKLEVSGISMREPLLVEFSRRYGGHLKRLAFKLNPVRWNGPPGDDGGVHYRFPALLQLNLFDTSWEFLPYLGRILAPQLRTLHLKLERIDQHLPKWPAPIVLLLQAVNKFPSLTILDLDFGSLNLDRLDYYNIGITEVLKEMEGHPNLEHLILRNWYYNLPLQCVVKLFPGLVSIKVLAVESTIYTAFYHMEWFHLYKNQMEHSNIWRELPRLQWIERWKMRGTCYRIRYTCTRAMADKLRGKEMRLIL